MPTERLSSLARQEVEARITVKTVEIFLRGKRVASHLLLRFEFEEGLRQPRKKAKKNKQDRPPA